MTAALSDYLASTANVSALLAIEGTYGDPPPSSDRAAVEGLRGGCVVLMVAAFENYLKESVAEAFDRVNTASPPCHFNLLPLELRTQAVFTGLSAAMKAKSWDPLKEKQLRLPGVMVAVAQINSGKILSREIAETAGSPNSAQVVELYKAVGVPSILTQIKRGFDTAWGGPTAKTFIGDTLNSVVNRRHVVAHTASIMSTSRTDLHEWWRFLSCLVSELDAALERHVTRVIANAQ